MTADDWTSMVRVLDGLLGLAALWLWIASAVHQWEFFTPRARRITVALSGLLLMLAIGFTDAAFDEDVPASWRPWAFMVVLSALVAVLAYRFRETEGQH